MEKLYKNEEFLLSYIGDLNKMQWYKKAFEKYDVNGVKNFTWNWSWYSFFFSIWYLVYRKCYKEAIGVAIVNIILNFGGVGSLLIAIAMGAVGPYLVYSRYRKVAEEIEIAELSFDKRLNMAKELGGTNKKAAIVVMVIMLVVISIMAIVGVMSAHFIMRAGY